MANAGKAIATTASIGAGVLGLGAIGYDAHRRGAQTATALPKRKEAENINELYLGLSKNNDSSAVGNAIHNSYVSMRTRTNIFRNIYTVGGYLSGVGTIIRDRFIPLAFGLTAVLGKGAIRYIGGVGLGLYGLNYILTRMFRANYS